jgi:flavin-dependent dehydrogenase
MNEQIEQFDVVIIGAGLAGLSLARQLTIVSGKSILLLEKRTQVPPAKQKVGEATVQLSGYYFSKVLDLEEHLLREHLMKYNLRFYWKTQKNHDAYENYSQSYIRNLSNIASYQLDRNKIEAELLRLNSQSPSFMFCSGISDLTVELSETEPHRVRYRSGTKEKAARAAWVVDATGRSKVLSRNLQLTSNSPIRHGSSFFWVEGLVNIEKLTNRPPQKLRVNKDRSRTGHLPVWLATNHFVGEGYWFWVIPLHGKTSFGLVFDREKIDSGLVSTPEKTLDWVCREFSLFARELKSRKILDHGMFRDFSYDCKQTISDSRWALTGEAGRFNDPLYSPGGDLIAVHNTLIADCILTNPPRLLRAKTRAYEILMQVLYQAYVPSYVISYEVLGDQECFAMKYAWELTVYFTFFVLPFINDLFTDLKFVGSFLREFAKLGALNRSLQVFITEYYRWKKLRYAPPSAPQFFDFTEFGPLRHSEKLFYQVGLTPAEAAEVLSQEMGNLREFALYIVTNVYAAVSGKQSLLKDEDFIASLDLENLTFDLESICQRASRYQGSGQCHSWGFDAECLMRLRGTPKQELEVADCCAAD